MLPFGYLHLPLQPRVLPGRILPALQLIPDTLGVCIVPFCWQTILSQYLPINLRPEILLFVLRTSPNLFGWMSLLRVIGTGIILITPVAYGSRPLLEERSGWSGPLSQIGLGRSREAMKSVFSVRPPV